MKGWSFVSNCLVYQNCAVLNVAILSWCSLRTIFHNKYHRVKRFLKINWEEKRKPGGSHWSLGGPERQKWKRLDNRPVRHPENWTLPVWVHLMNLYACFQGFPLGYTYSHGCKGRRSFYMKRWKSHRIKSMPLDLRKFLKSRDSVWIYLPKSYISFCYSQTFDISLAGGFFSSGF